jgi:hypothetical protein
MCPNPPARGSAHSGANVCSVDEGVNHTCMFIGALYGVTCRRRRHAHTTALNHSVFASTTPTRTGGSAYAADAGNPPATLTRSVTHIRANRTHIYQCRFAMLHVCPRNVFYSSHGSNPAVVTHRPNTAYDPCDSPM